MLPLPPSGLPEGWTIEQWDVYGPEYYLQNPHLLSELLEQNQEKKEPEIEKISIKHSSIMNLYQAEKENFEDKRVKRKKVIIALVVLLVIPIPINGILKLIDESSYQDAMYEDTDMDGIDDIMDACLDSSLYFEVDDMGCTKEQGGNPYYPIDLTARSLNRDARLDNWWLDEDSDYNPKGFNVSQFPSGYITISDLNSGATDSTKRVVVLHFLPFEDIDWYYYRNFCQLHYDFSSTGVQPLERIMIKSDEWNASQGKFPIQLITIITDYATNSFEDVRSTFSNSCSDNESHSGHPDNIFFWPIAYGSANSVPVCCSGLTADLESELNVYSESLFIVDTDGYVVAREDNTDGDFNWNSFDTILGNAVNGNTEHLRTNASRVNDCPYDKRFRKWWYSYNQYSCEKIEFHNFDSGEVSQDSYFFYVVYASSLMIGIIILSVIAPKYTIRLVIKKSRVAVNVGNLTRAVAMLKAYSDLYPGNTKLSEEYKHVRRLVEIDRTNQKI